MDHDLYRFCIPSSSCISDRHKTMTMTLHFYGLMMIVAREAIEIQRIELEESWQKRHDERFADYTEEDWKQEHEMQKMEVLQMNMRY